MCRSIGWMSAPEHSGGDAALADIAHRGSIAGTLELLDGFALRQGNSPRWMFSVITSRM